MQFLPDEERQPLRLDGAAQHLPERTEAERRKWPARQPGSHRRQIEVAPDQRSRGRPGNGQCLRQPAHELRPERRLRAHHGNRRAPSREVGPREEAEPLPQRLAEVGWNLVAVAQIRRRVTGAGRKPAKVEGHPVDQQFKPLTARRPAGLRPAMADRNSSGGLDGPPDCGRVGAGPRPEHE